MLNRWEAVLSFSNIGNGLNPYTLPHIHQKWTKLAFIETQLVMNQRIFHFYTYF